LLFCSQAFFVFFVVVFTVYWLLPTQSARVGWLLASSIYFYASWNHWLAALIVASTTADYLIARRIEANESPGRRRALLLLSICGNLGLLTYFKYANFFLRSVEEALRAAGAEASLPVLKVILPIGISFYTFEAISYTTEVYRRRVPAEKSLPRLLLFITFFPHLVAGPIVRPWHFLPQLRRPKHWDWMRLQLGAQLFLLGLFKKLAIADRMALFADPVFAEPAKYGSLASWAAVLAYSLQIYCDFSGYSDMAVGLAHTLGYKLPRNFDVPYSAMNVSEFWRRWHISLSTWLRDYLFIPLGGSRTEHRWQTTRNLMITMTLGGLWHGAAANFVAWGFLHGSLLILHRRVQDFAERRHEIARALDSIPGRALSMATTFGCVSFAWVLFRASSLADAAVIWGHLIIPHGGSSTPYWRESLFVLGLLVAGSHVAARIQLFKRLERRLPPPILGLGYAAAAAITLLLAPDASKAFIYFQF
jgi:alginate O-acetyltransferase complex protein AlgI